MSNLSGLLYILQVYYVSHINLFIFGRDGKIPIALMLDSVMKKVS